jgi:hypothetical protein
VTLGVTETLFGKEFAIPRAVVTLATLFVYLSPKWKCQSAYRVSSSSTFSGNTVSITAVITIFGNEADCPRSTMSPLLLE